MRFFRMRAMAVATAIFTATFALQAQDVGTVVHMDGPGVTAVVAKPVAQPASGQLTPAQQSVIARGSALRPGVYVIRSVLAGSCIFLSGGVGEYIVKIGTTCDPNPNWAGGQQFAVLPHPAGGYTVRSVSKYIMEESFPGLRPPSAGEIGNCNTVARGVILGAPRIELQPCDPTGSDWARAGTDDQRFFIGQVGPNSYEIGLALTGDTTDCWTLRDGARSFGTEVIRWTCNRTPDQFWQFVWVKPIPQGSETALLDRTGWYYTPAGHFSVLAADGLDLTGPVFHSFDTANDNGDYCRKRCAETDRCKAWTWTGPGYVTNSNDPPRCYWKSSAGEAINRGPQSFAKLKSGIVRP